MNKMDVIAKIIHDSRAKNVLDIACYTGRQYDAIKKNGYDVKYTGVDVKSPGWDKYKYEPDVTLIKQDIDSFLKTCRKKFDVVIYSGMMDWLGNENEMLSYNPFETLRLLKRVMHKNSRLILVTVNNGTAKRIITPRRLIPQMHYLFDRQTLREDLRRLGYSVIKDVYLPWETWILEKFRNIFFRGKWSNNELVFVCKKR